jgi:hypothetical protein
MPEQLEAHRQRGLCAVCLREGCDGKSCDWALGDQQPMPTRLSTLDRMDICRELAVREANLAELLARSPSHSSPGAQQMLVARLARVRELIALLAVLCLALVGCVEAHGRIEGPPLYLHLCDAMPAADQEAWGAAAGALNAELEQPAVWVGHGPPSGCSTVDVCPSDDVLADAEVDVGTCVVTVRYAPGAARDVASQEIDLLLRGLP